MVTPFQKRKPKTSRNNNNIMFTDFSEGLYLLDTPRDILEQLGSLALKGGRNVCSEKGALIPQYGYYPLTELGELPVEEKIIAVSKDDKSSSTFFTVTNLGNVYLYTAFQGLKRYKTTLDVTNEEILKARSNNNLIMYYNSSGHLFGDYYEDSDIVSIDNGCITRNYGAYAEVDVPATSKIYYWNGKRIYAPGCGVYTVSNMRGGEGDAYLPYSYRLLEGMNCSLRGTIAVNTEAQKIQLSEKDSIFITKEKHTATQETTVITEDKELEAEAYYYNATRGNLSYLGVPNSGVCYKKPGESKVYIKNSAGNLVLLATTVNYKNTDIMVVDIPAGSNFSFSGNGLLPLDRWNNLNPLFPVLITRTPDQDSYKAVEKTETIETGEYYTYKVNYSFDTTSGVKTFTSSDINAGLYEWEVYLSYQNDVGNIRFSLYQPNSSTAKVRSNISNSKLLVLQQGDEYTPRGVKVIDGIGEILNLGREEISTLTLIPDPDNKYDIATIIDLTEKTYLPLDMVYTPEEEGVEQKVLIPTLLEVCMNRLCIVNYDGFIYYTGVGITRANGELKLEESAGAGYFGGFFNDNSKTLSLDDYLTGALITKQNGLYYLTIADNISSDSVSAEGNVGINIKKVAEIGQEYATDHIIVKEQVYAYDSNSDAIVLACTTNMFGSVVPGKVLIDAEFLNAQNFGIASSKRCLTFNKDAQVFILYYGDDLKHGILLNTTGNLFPREMDRPMQLFQGFNQGVIGITIDNVIVQDYHKNTIIPDIPPVADFEAIGLKDSRCICCSIAEVAELNGIEYDFLTTNTITSFQHIKPYTNFGIDKIEIPPMIYSDERRVYNSYGITPEEEWIDPIDLAKIKGLNKWADKKSNSTKIYAPMSGRGGININIQFPANVAFCLAGIRLVDFSQGE